MTVIDMESKFEHTMNSQSDREFYADMERRRQRRLQKKRKQKRKKRIILLFLGICLIFIVTMICIKSADKSEIADGDTGETVSEENSAQESKMQVNSAEMMLIGNVGKEVAELSFSEVMWSPLDSETKEESGTQEGTQQYYFEATAETMNIYSEEVFSTNAILVDVNTDEIVAVKGAYDRISPASMTKVLTILVAAEEIEKADLDDTFTMTLEITDYAYVNDCSYVGFQDGEVVTVRDLFYGTVLPSGGDAAVGLATYVAGSHEAFVDMMNAKLEELGLSDSAHFTNCVGLYDANHYCTVYDMAVIMDAAMENELCREILSAHTYTTTSTTQHPEGIEISNWFLRRIEDKDTGGLVVGAKTGYVVESGNCGVSYEEYADGTPYICVTANAHSSWRCIYDHVEIYNRYIPSGE